MKILASDFDDTLYFRTHGLQRFFKKGGLKKEDIKAIRRFQKAGNWFGICTGRPPAMKPVMEGNLNGEIHPDFYIFSNGCCVVDEKGTPVFEAFIPKEVPLDLLERFPDERFFLQQRKALEFVSGNELKKDPQRKQAIDFDHVFAVCFDYTTDHGKKVLEYCRTLSGVQPLCNAQYCDMVCADQNKGKGLYRFLESRNLTSQPIAAIGDSYNDLAMIEAATPGFTLSSSPMDIQEKADYVVEGIAEAIEILMKDPD